MKNTFEIILLSIVLFGASFVLVSAKEADLKGPYDLPPYTVEEVAVLPEPISHPLPTVSNRVVGLDVRVKLTVNENGKPENVRLEKPLISYSDLDKMSFAGRLENAVQSWKFEPALDSLGNPMAVDVILPVKVVRKGSKLATVAALILDMQFEEVPVEATVTYSNI